jgi:hypothetical protein
MTKQMKTETENKASAESAAKTKKKNKADIIAAANAAGIARTHYTRDEACAPANMSESQLRILRKLGFGPKETGLGRSVRFPVGPFAAWLEWIDKPETRDMIKKGLKQERERLKQERERREAAAEELKKQQQQGVPPQVPPADGAAAT